MKPCPRTIGEARVVCYTTIDDRHRFTGRCAQIVAGQLMPAMAGLAICQDEGASAFWLFGCDGDWKPITDTWHETLDAAKQQAEAEYEGVRRTWIELAG